MPAILYSAGGDTQVPLRIGSTNTTGREEAVQEQELWRRKPRTRKPDKICSKETQDVKEKQLQTVTGEIAFFKAWR